MRRRAEKKRESLRHANTENESHLLRRKHEIMFEVKAIKLSNEFEICWLFELEYQEKIINFHWKFEN